MMLKLYIYICVWIYIYIYIYVYTHASIYVALEWMYCCFPRKGWSGFTARTCMNPSCGICPPVAAAPRVTTPCNGRIWRNPMVGFEWPVWRPALKMAGEFSVNQWMFISINLPIFNGELGGLPCTAWKCNLFSRVLRWAFSVFSVLRLFFECCGR